jgi:hypothetical protein
MERTGTTTVIPHRPPLDPNGPGGRLAELVAHLSECPPTVAVDAVRRSLPTDDDDLTADERLAVVAGALVRLRRDIDLRDHRRRTPA